MKLPFLGYNQLLSKGTSFDGSLFTSLLILFKKKVLFINPWNSTQSKQMSPLNEVHLGF